MTWTNDKPTIPGAYWIRGNGLEMPALLHVRPDEEHGGVLSCNLHQRTTEFDMAYSYTIEQLAPEFEWSGPLVGLPEMEEALVRLVAVEQNAANLAKWEQLLQAVRK